jgi:hypothetical protein
MNGQHLSNGVSLLILVALAGCGGESSDPIGPSGPQSFLAGTWRGTMTILPNPTAPAAADSRHRPRDVDLRSGSTDKPADVQDDDSVPKRLVAEHRDDVDIDDSGEHPTRADQHARRI